MFLAKLTFLCIGLVAYMNLAIAKGNPAPSFTSLRPINQGSNSGIQTEHFEVIRDNTSLLTLWQLHTRSISQSNSTTPQLESPTLESKQLTVLNPELPQIASPTSKLPTIDFNKEMLIAAFAGNKNSGGYLINITEVDVLVDKIEINVVLIKPSNNCMVTSSITQPYVMLAVHPTSDKPAHFNLHIKTKNCETGAID